MTERHVRRSDTRSIVARWLVLPFAGWAVFRTFDLTSSRPAVLLLVATPWVAALAVLMLLVTVALRRWIPAAVAGLVTAALLLAVLPRAVPGRGTPDRDERQHRGRPRRPRRLVRLVVLPAVLVNAADGRHRPHSGLNYKTPREVAAVWQDHREDLNPTA